MAFDDIIWFKEKSFSWYVMFIYFSNKSNKWKTTNENYNDTAQKMKFSIKNFFSKCDQIRSLLRTWSHLLKKSLMENFFFCAVRREKSQECLQQSHLVIRGGSRTAATSKMELFAIIVNGFQRLTIMTKCFIVDVEAVLDPPLVISFTFLLIEPSLF